MEESLFKFSERFHAKHNAHLKNIHGHLKQKSQYGFGLFLIQKQNSFGNFALGYIQSVDAVFLVC